jgi:putative selenate reductase molybdopterin-binding subunit
MVLAAKALLEKNPDPTEAEIREALSGILDRETGYVKPVQAVQAAAKMLRGEEPDTPPPNVLTPIDYDAGLFGDGGDGDGRSPDPTPDFDDGNTITKTVAPTKPKVSSGIPETAVVGKSEMKVDAVKLAKGNAAFVDDVEMRGML